MQCDEISEKLSAYVDRELDESDYSRIQQHIASCSQCEELVNEFSQISQCLQSSFAELFAADSLERMVLNRIESIRTRTQSVYLGFIVALGSFFMTCITIAALLSPWGIFVWKAINVSSRLGHGMYMVALHVLDGMHGMAVDVALLVCVIAGTAFWIMSKLIRQTSVQQLDPTTYV
ncbi:zf-HC2 domain-containing protein [Fodinisporobacter ferrooxydans]|uniref:Anti-sigma-W factor RsiW n=1 Tax=Fodinisporobacter ferrooxydans TaxID=2901836 RepID=A0ABY4CKA0_9BACL|nr:zf-HC2 domain-containing protein [Alicyclobacillaceae bacterium MYW30-H2]